MKRMHEDIRTIIRESLLAVMPETAVRKALQRRKKQKGRLYLAAVGKAAWQMANTAYEIYGTEICDGIVITKYGHSRGSIGHLKIYEAGHPVPDKNSFQASRAVLNLVGGLSDEDQVLFMISGGGSSLFEIPLCSPEELQRVTEQLLARGADITEINTIRKRLSAVKGGKFAKACEPAEIFSVVLSDIIGDPLDMIASGPACRDKSTSEQALAIAAKYQLEISDSVLDLLKTETPQEIRNVETYTTGSVKELCRAAMEACERIGYRPVFLTDSLTCEAREAGSFLAGLARSHQHPVEPLAFIAGGETVVHVTGNGLGGRNQEIALAAAIGLDGLKNTVLAAVGSDGTDGPTDAAGGIVDQDTLLRLRRMGMNAQAYLSENDSYHALEAVEGLAVTGPTGTNVNDVAVLLIR